MLLSDLVSVSALKWNPLVTSWDDASRPTCIEFEDGMVISGVSGTLAEACARLDSERRVAALATLDAFRVREFILPASSAQLVCGRRALVMGIINTTPDSFSDGGEHYTKEAAVEHGLRLVEQGADILDVGGESARPGAEPVPADEERRRTEPVVAELARRCRVPVSIDTSKAAVAAAALDAGAAIVNDITALGDPAMAPLVARTGAVLILMHMQGEPRTMQKNPVYGNVLREIAMFLRRSMARAAAAGVDLARVVIDPGIGFGKTLEHNLEILRRLPVLASLGRPILTGCSRKSLIGGILGLPVKERLNATLALNVLSIIGRASIIRVHDVKEALEAARMTTAVLYGGPS